MSQITLNRVVSVSLQAALQGLSNANTSALALITADAPLAGANYGTYGIYYSAAAVAQDWGSNSETYALAVAAFSQNPNILSAGGYLVIIPRVQTNPAQAAVLLSSGPVDLTQLTGSNYEISLGINGAAAVTLLIGAINSSSIAAAQASLNSTAVVAAGVAFVVSGTPTSATIQLVTSTTGATAEIQVGPTVTAGVNVAPSLGLTGTVYGTAAGLECIRDAILRTYTAVFYFGIIVSVIPTDVELPAIAGLVQSIDKIFFYGESVASEVTGNMATLTASGYINTRGLFYSVSVAAALVFAASYASQALSVNFQGSNTVMTMNLNTVIGLPADPGLTETLVTACQSAGVDVYADFGVPRLLTSGANAFFDQVYVGLAFKLSMRVAGFNYLSAADTVIPQTEDGMNGLKAAYRSICKQFINNGAFAPGTWNGTTFGNPQDMVRNIGDFGFYIFSLPIAQQSQTVRNTRAAPLIQIACKSAGAIHSSNVVLSVQP